MATGDAVLETGPGDDKLAEVKKWYDEWESETEEPRRLSERDEDYYDGNQLTPDEVRDLTDRGQPIIIKNRIAKKINFLLGNEIANRSDPKALPRTQEVHDEDAQAITDGIRYVVDVEDFDLTASRTYKQMLCPGYGGAIVEHEERDTPNGTAFDIKIRQVPFDRLWYDIRSRREDFADAKYIGVVVWWHVDEAIAHYAKKRHRAENFADVLKQGVFNDRVVTDTHDDKPTSAGRWTQAGSRVKVAEVYYKDSHPETGKVVWFVGHYTGAGWLVPPRPTGHKNDKGEDICPLVATTAYVTREGHRYGPVRHMIGPQDEINKRSSKSVHHAVMERMTVEENVILDLEQARAERAKPDGVVIVQRNALKEQRLQYDKGMVEAQFHAQATEAAKQDIDQIGPEIPQIGAVSGGASGRALQQRQMIGALEIAALLDNLRRWRRAIYERVWWKIKQLWTTETWLRIRDDPEGKGYRFVGLNRKMTKGERFQELVEKGNPPDQALHAVNVPPQALLQVMQRLQQEVQARGEQIPDEQMQELGQQALLASPPMQEPFTAADVAAIDVDIVIEETPDVAVVQQEELQELRETAQSMMASGNSDPATNRLLMKMIVKAGQLRAKKELLEAIEQPPDPQQVQIQQQQMQLQMAQLQAQVQVLTSQAALNQAKAASEQIEAEATNLKAPTEAELNEAKALQAQAAAGEKTGQVLGGG